MKHITSCLLIFATWCYIFAQELPPVQGFPNGEEVLNQKSVPYVQPEPHLVYERNGFIGDQLMSKVPPVGVHPRVMISPEDVPRIRENISTYSFNKRYWEKIILGHVKVKPKNAKEWDPYAAKLKDPSECNINVAAFYALVMDDQEYGKRVAEVTAEKAAEIDTKLDEIDANEAYPDLVWFKVRKTGIWRLAMAYDYAFNFMTKEQQDRVRKVISKATKGRYNHGMELPRSWRTWNWPQFGQQIVNWALAIEGEEGYEPRIFEICKQSVVDFITYKISPEGYDFETTGYNGLAYGGGGIQSIYAVARRISPNPFMHPHFQAQPAAYIGQQAGPNGPWHGRGDSGGGAPVFNLVHLMRCFYPEDPRWKMTWPRSAIHQGLSPRGGRLRGVGGVFEPYLLYSIPDEDEANERDFWGKDKTYPVTYEAPSRGFMGTRTNWDPENSIAMTFAVYNKLRDAGHDGPDAGTFSLWANGVNWYRFGDKLSKNSSWRSSVTIDGQGAGYGMGPGLFMPVVDEPMATSARGDMSYSYSWKIVNGRYNVLYSPLFQEDPGNYLNDWAWKRVKTLRTHEPDPTPFSKEFWTMASTNYGLWLGEDRHPTRRVPRTPVERAFRSVTLVRGDAALNNGNGHPYVLTVDDIQKDDQQRSYDWIFPMAGKNEVVKAHHEWKGKIMQEMLIRRIPTKPRGHKGDQWPPKLAEGDRMLLVRVLNRNFEKFPSIRFDRNPSLRYGDVERIIIPSHSTSPDYKVLIYPHRHGDPLPKTRWNEAKTRLRIEIGDQVDYIDFTTAHVDRRPFGGHGEQTYFTITRETSEGESKLITVGGPPSLPRFETAGREFTDKQRVAFKPGKPGQMIFYTTDGSEPTTQSTRYKGPFEISESTTIRAITYAPNWEHGDAKSRDYKELVKENFIINKPAEYRQLVSTINPKASRPVTAVYTKVKPEAGDVQMAQVVNGVELKVYELPISIWRGSKVDLESPLMPADLNAESPIYHTYQKGFEVPRVLPTVDVTKMYQGVYAFSGYVSVDQPGRYRFKMRSCGPTRLTVGDKQLIDIPGPYHVILADREGEVLLEPGLHRFEAIFSDPSFFVSESLEVVDFDLAMQAPGEPGFTAITPERLYRKKDFSFNIAHNLLEVGTPLTITDERGDGLEVSMDNGKTFMAYKEPMVFDRGQTVDVQVRRKGSQDVIGKTVKVAYRLSAVDEVPVLRKGMVRQRYLRPVQATFTLKKDHNENAGHQIIAHPKDPTEDIFDLVETAPSLESVVVKNMLGDKVGGTIRRYTGYWWVTEAAPYEFTMDNSGSNKLYINGKHIASNHIPGAVPEGMAILEPGWHAFDVMYENTHPGITVKGPFGTKENIVGELFCPREVNEISYLADASGYPSSFLMASWFMPGKEKNDIRMKSEIHGAVKAEGDTRPGAYRFSGDDSMILGREVSQASSDLTLSMWIKPEFTKDTKGRIAGQQFLWNRQNTGWVYSQRGSMSMMLKGDQLMFQGGKLATLKDNEWVHVAVTLRYNTTNNSGQLEGWINGEKVKSWMVTRKLHINSYYMEWFGRIDRQKTDIDTTQKLGYQEAKESGFIEKSFKGEAAEVRMYDAALPPEAIRKLAGQK